MSTNLDSVPPDPAHMPERVGRYRMVRKLGEGGMGIVYAAHDERLDRPVAIKMIRQDAADARSRERLWREARSAASVSHPNICQLYEIGEEDGLLFIAMELLEGESLALRIARGPLPIGEASHIGLAMLAALEALHARGLIHRDLKPSNVFLSPVGVKLLDFGLARPVEAPGGQTETRLSLPGTIVGTPHYLAPEQLVGQPVDARSDLFGAGAVLYEMLTGRPPFGGASMMQVLHAVLYEQPPVLGGAPAVAALDRIIHRALAKKPDDRYQSARAMADDLRGAMALGDSTETPPRVRPMTRLIVLPFRALRADPETDFLSFSVADAITSSLSGLESLIVRSSLSASRFAGSTPDLAAIGTQADVDIVLTGTLLRAGDQLRVNTQLVEAPGGAVLWSQTSQVPLGDIFQLQDDLTRRIVDSLQLPLTARDHRMLKHNVPASAKAYEFYLRANQLAYQAANWTVARDLYRQCLEDDPQYAPAWARLGRLYRVIAIYSGQAVEENYAHAQEAFTRALELNPDLSLAHNLYTHVEVELGRAKEAMLRLLERAGRQTGDPDLYAGLVQALRYCGLLEPAAAADEHARRLDPGIRTSVAHVYYMLGDPERALAASLDDPKIFNVYVLAQMRRSEEALALIEPILQLRLPDYLRLWVELMRLLVLGRREEALTLCDPLLESLYVRDPCVRYYVASHLAQVGHPRALATLRESVDRGFYCSTFLTRDPTLDPLRGAEEFRGIVRRAEARRREAQLAFLAAGGDRILGVASER